MTGEDLAPPTDPAPPLWMEDRWGACWKGRVNLLPPLPAVCTWGRDSPFWALRASTLNGFSPVTSLKGAGMVEVQITLLFDLVCGGVKRVKEQLRALTPWYYTISLPLDDASSVVKWTDGTGETVNLGVLFLAHLSTQSVSCYTSSFLCGLWKYYKTSTTTRGQIFLVGILAICTDGPSM